MSLNWWDKSCFKCSETSQRDNKKLIPLNCYGRPKRRISATTSRYLSRPFSPFLCAERVEGRSDQEINFCQQFPEVWLINKCGHGISYSLFKEIETEFALKVINEQTLNWVLNPDECNPAECTFSGAGWIWSLSWSAASRNQEIALKLHALPRLVLAAAKFHPALM